MESTQISKTVINDHWLEVNDALLLYNPNDLMVANDKILEYNSCNTEVTLVDSNQEKYIPFIPLFSEKPATENNKKKFTKKINKWQGIVEDISDGVFFAKLYDIKQGGTYETAEFSISDEVSPEDKDFVKEGAIFYWFVGYVSDRGTIVKQSEVRFRRTANLSTSDVDLISDLSSEKYKNISWK